MKRVLKRILLGMVICMMFSSLFGCGYKGRANRLQKELRSDKEYATYYFEQVTGALEKNDKDALKKLFSAYATNNAPQLDAQMEELMEFYPGCNEGYELNISTYETSAYSGKEYILKAKYNITNDGENYLLRVVAYTENAVTEDKLGIYLIQVLTKEDLDNGMMWKEVDSEPGIYVRE